MPPEPASKISYGVFLDEENDTWSLSATDRDGEENISGLTPSIMLNFAVMLARAARGKGVDWPSVLWRDVEDREAVTGLQEQLGEPAPTATSTVDPEVMRDFVRETLRDVLGILRHAIATVQDARDDVDQLE